jgi:hypothetical protein
MAYRTAGRKGHRYRQAQARCFAEETHCYFGDGYVDQTLANYRSSRARSIHHLIPPDIAPHLANNRDNMRLAHIGCNARYGRGQYEGQGLKSGRPPRGQQRRTHARRYTRAGVSVPMREPVTTDRDW